MTSTPASAPSPASAQPAAPWSRGLRLVASLVILWHLVGVMVAPISTPPRFDGPDSVIGSKLREAYLPYITALYLNHAYKFFAPNPGDSHLLRYDLRFADGTERVNRDDQLLPDRLRHWPRLLYHRHFMLTEFINDGAPPWVWERDANAAGPPGAAAGLPGSVLPTTATPATAAAPQGEAVPPVAEPGPNYVQQYIDGIAAHLARRYGALRVDLYYRKHLLPSIDDFRRVGNRLDSPESYRERLVKSYAPEPKS